MAGVLDGSRTLRGLAIVGLLLVLPATAAGAPPPEPGLDLPVRLDLPVPLARQNGDRANCGPTAAAMLLAAYQGLDESGAVGALRDALGRWSWDRFPMRSWRLPGRDAGMTTPAMFLAMLERFGDGVRFEPVAQPYAPRDVWATLRLRQALATGRPVVALVETPPLWGTRAASLHWVVVRGLEGDRVIYNDPADARRWETSLERFLDAWELNPLFRALPGLEAYTAFVADRPLPGDRAIWASR